MFFIASKVFFALARPYHLAILLLIIGTIALLAGYRRLSTGLIVLVTVSLVTISFTPLSQWIAQPLEARFPRPTAVEPAPDGIIVLGGGFDVMTQAGHGTFISLNEAAERITEIPALARQYPNARIIYTGGPAEEGQDILSEAQGARRLFIEAGIDPARITLEDRSLTTWDNAVFSRDIVKPAPGSRWLLVTSAFHMPRAMGVFRQAGWPGLVAFPTDYRAPAAESGARSRMVGVENLWLFEIASKEYIGLLGYWLSGRSAALFPAP